jgi:hypothetical protein
MAGVITAELIAILLQDGDDLVIHAEPGVVASAVGARALSNWRCRARMRERRTQFSLQTSSLSRTAPVQIWIALRPRAG